MEIQPINSIQLLSEIGQAITASLSFESVVETVYANVSRVMDSTVFAIGILNEAEQRIDYPTLIEQGRRLQNQHTSLKDTNRVGTWCILEGKEVFSNNWEQDYKDYIHSLPNVEGNRPQSIIYMPLQARKETIGVITIQSYLPNAYTEEHRVLLRQIALFTGIGVENARLYGQLEEQVAERTRSLEKQKQALETQNERVQQSFQEVKLLSEMGRSIASTLMPEEIFETVCQHLGKLLDYTVTALALYQHGHNTLSYWAHWRGHSQIHATTVEVSEDTPIARWCVIRKEELMSHNVVAEYGEQSDAIIPTLPPSLEEEDSVPCHSVMYIPLLIKDRLLGLFTVQHHRPQAFTSHQTNIIRHLTTSIATAMDNAALYEGQEEMIRKRTAEVIKSRDELEVERNKLAQSYEHVKLLSEIGMQITANLNIERIINTVYEKVNNLMDANIFGIGLYNSSARQLEFPALLENGDRQPMHIQPLDNDDRFSVWCFKQQKEVFSNNLDRDWPQYVNTKPSPPIGKMTYSVIYLPLRVKEKPVGVITVQSVQRNAYSEYHLDILRNVAVYVAIALENADVYRQLNEKNREINEEKLKLEQIVRRRTEEIAEAYENIKLMSKIGRDITTALSIDRIVEITYGNINSLMDATVFTIGVYNHSLHRLEFPCIIEKGEVVQEFVTYYLDEDNLALRTFKRCQEFMSNDWETEYIDYQSSANYSGIGDIPQSLIYLPLISKDETIGVLTVQSFEKGVYTEFHRYILRNLAIYTAIALENALLYENLEEKVRERTAEVIRQRDEIEQQRNQITQSFMNVKLLSEIGQKITAQLQREQIINTVYEHVNSLMDANGFGLGFYDHEEETLTFSSYLEMGQLISVPPYPLNQTHQLAVWCFNQDQEAVVNDWGQEASDLLEEVHPPLEGDIPESLIYIPLRSKSRRLGIITVKSFEKNAYNNYHVSILRNMALYTSIALENADSFQKLNETLDKLKKAQKQLVEVEKMASLGQLTAGIAHEINNPINYVYAGINSLKTNIDDVLEVLNAYQDLTPENAAEQLTHINDLKDEIEFDLVIDELSELTESIKRGAKRTTEIVKGLRSFSRLDEDDVKLADINESLDNTLVMLRNKFKNRIDIVRNYGTLPKIECYPGKLSQVFMNIIANAIEAIQGKGIIELHTIEGPKAHITIEITDTGPGMPEEVKRRIFEPFYTTKDVGEGTGLGLSITHGIIEKHRGTISVETEEGEGTTFRLELPIKQLE